MQSKHEFYHRGGADQFRPDLVISMRRPDIDKIQSWTPEQKQRAKEWIARQEKIFEAFKQEILKGCE